MDNNSAQKHKQSSASTMINNKSFYSSLENEIKSPTNLGLLTHQLIGSQLSVALSRIDYVIRGLG